MKLLSNTNLNLVSGGININLGMESDAPRAQLIAEEMCLNASNTFIAKYISSPADQQTAIFEANYPKVKEICTVAAIKDGDTFWLAIS